MNDQLQISSTLSTSRFNLLPLDSFEAIITPIEEEREGRVRGGTSLSESNNLGTTTTLVEELGRTITASKNGEIGWNPSDSSGEEEEGGNSRVGEQGTVSGAFEHSHFIKLTLPFFLILVTRTIIPQLPMNTTASLQTQTIKTRHPFPFLNRFHPATGKLFSLVVGLTILIATVAVLLIVLNSRVGDLDDDSDDGNGSNLTLSNSSSTSNANPFNLTSSTISLNNNNSTTNSLASNSSSPSINSASTNSITDVIVIVCLIVEAIYVYSRTSNVYAFFRIRTLMNELSFITDLESSRSTAEVEGEEVVIEQLEDEGGLRRQQRSTSSNRTTSMARRQYHPTGFRKYFELALALPPSALVPTPLPRLSSSLSSRSNLAAQRMRLNSLSEEDAIIERAHREGSAPIYGSDEMRGSKMLLKSSSLRRWSWRVLGGAEGEDENGEMEMNDRAGTEGNP